MIKQLFAIIGILFLLLAGILDSLDGGWKLLALSIIYAVANTIIFII